jgi:hypothetical protein
MPQMGLFHLYKYNQHEGGSAGHRSHYISHYAPTWLASALVRLGAESCDRRAAQHGQVRFTTRTGELLPPKKTRSRTSVGSNQSGSVVSFHRLLVDTHRSQDKNNDDAFYQVTRLFTDGPHKKPGLFQARLVQFRCISEHGVNRVVNLSVHQILVYDRSSSGC